MHVASFAPPGSVIDTPELFEKLKAGQIGTAIDEIFIKPGAHPNILSLPKEFADAPYAIHFVDDQNNRVFIAPKEKLVEASFTNGHSLSLHLPSYYVKYNVSYIGVAITAEDLDYIFQWNRAAELTIRDGDDDGDGFGYMISQRSDDLKKLQNLTKLSFALQRPSYNKLFIKNILFGPKALRTVNVLRSSLSAGEFKEFVRNQKFTLKWISVLFRDRIVYFRDIVRM